jgi:hypothetical protein
MTCLSDLPTEILQQIAGHLVRNRIERFVDHGMYNLRLTCRALCLKTEYEFGRAAFSTLQLDLHSRTLQRFQKICRRPAFGKAIKKLIFAHREHPREYVAFPQVSEEEPGNLEEQVRFVLKSVLDEAFGGTPNLKEIVILTPCDALFRRHDYIPPTGIMAIQFPINDVILVEEYRVKAETLYTLITRALIDAEIHLTAFQLQSTGDAYPATYLPTVSINEAMLAATSEALKHVKRFEIKIRADEDFGPRISLGQTLSSMSSLTWLELGMAVATSGPFSLASDFTSTAAFRSLQDAHLPHLTRLKMCYVMIDERVLYSFLLLHTATLRSLSLKNVYLGMGEQWLDILALLLDEMASLTTLHIVQMRNDASRAAKRGRISLAGREALTNGLRSRLGRA